MNKIGPHWKRLKQQSNEAGTEMKNHGSDFRRIKDSTYDSMPGSPARSKRGGRIQRLADGGTTDSADVRRTFGKLRRER